jgi:tRNA threonylcarbamoyladenosine biosynthesis protein TsaB
LRILAFESSAKAASVAVLQDGKLLGEYYQNSGRTHSRTLMQMASDLLRGCDLTPGEIDACAVAAGPGSFTGVRIGVAAAKGFCWGLELPLYGVSTLLAMARGAGPFDGLIVPVMDARRSEVYCAAFSSEGGTLSRVGDDAALSLDELAKKLEKSEIRKLLVGDGAELCYNTLDGRVPGLVLAPEHLRFQHAAGVALCAAERAAAGERPDAGSLRPSYLRVPQAERERNERLKTERSSE